MIFIVLFFPPLTLTFHILRARSHRRTVVDPAFISSGGYDSSWLLHMLTALDSLMAFGRLQIAPALLTLLGCKYIVCQIARGRGVTV